MRHLIDVAVLISLLLGLTTFLSCGGGQTNDFNSQEFDTFTTVYAELAIGFEMAQSDSSVYLPIRDSILSELGIDTVWLSEYSVKMNESPENWLKVWEEVTRKLEVKRDSLMP